MKAETLKARTISSMFWKLMERGGTSLVALIVQIVLARLLAPDDFGALAIMLVFVNLGNVIVQSGLNTSLVQASNVDRRDFSTVFWMCFATATVLYVVVFLAAPAVAAFYQYDALVVPLRVLTIILFINAFNSVQVASVQRELQFRKIFWAGVVSVVASGALGIASAALGAGLWALVVQQLAYQVIYSFVLFVQNRWLPQFTFSAERARVHFSFGWKLLVSGLLQTGYESLSDLIIGKQFSQAQLGLVSQGKKYPAALGTTLDGAIQPVMMSAVARAKDDLANVKGLVRRAIKTSTFLILPAMGLFAVTAQPIVLLLLGEQWLPCVPFMQMYCVVYAMLPIHTTNLQTLNGMGRSDLFLKLEIIKKCYGIAFILFFGLVLKDIYLMVGAYILSGIISTFVNAHPNKRVIGYSYGEQLRDIAPGIALTVVAMALAAPLALLGLPALGQIAVQVVVFVGAYVLLAKLFHVEEFGYLVGMAREAIPARRGR
ncbi:lipopolysaccharide biosynthesis protein [Denitrobacterium detoxificans]|jgi:O-antigen/teichoic acid export membrane protein|uniref:lipopolysaccharide biosynthesis protein n=1 Tax=Denitrobacterium detoxificans TaxID=79604 RepID=UPI0026F10BC6|nr:lipopolysaccharide biosynthesis protein [Denitrobacterium detoxificans]MBE6466268.1 lipopolysaccharide biosynthesis protein [Denitrobacterium detoxificans]